MDCADKVIVLDPLCAADSVSCGVPLLETYPASEIKASEPFDRTDASMIEAEPSPLLNPTMM